VPHFPKPFFRPKRQRWYVQLDGKQINLGPDEEAAFERYHTLMAGRAKSPPARADGTPLVALLDDYLDWCQRHRKRETYLSYLERIQSFTSHLKSRGRLILAVQELKPFHVREWVDAQDTWSPGMKRGRIMAVQTALNWAAEEGRIDRSPIAKMKKPSQGKRDTVITPAEYLTVLANVRNRQFRELLTCAWESGARPQELLAVEKRHFQDGCWVFPPKEAKGNKWRVVYLSEAALEIVRRLNDEHPEGPIFRNTHGVPWDPFAVNCAFCRLRKKLGKKYCLYNFRHS
jgi:integrase